MILVIDLTCPMIPVLSSEFVNPVINIVKKVTSSVLQVRLEECQSLKGVSGIIICGTALADTWYLESDPSFIREISDIPVLGICAGMQILIREDGGMLAPATEIGMISIERILNDHLLDEKDLFSGYALHQYGVKLPKSWIALACSDKSVQIAKKNNYNIYGVLFHPEVRNEWLIERFCSLVSLS